MKTLGVIPARYGAQRFPGKPLALIAGQPLIRRVYDRARRATRLDHVIVATDDTRILETVTGFGGDAALTSPTCATGTDRIAEVARQYDCTWVVNIQGDEPLMRPEMIDQLVEGIQADAACSMATLVRPIESAAVLQNPNVVKVVVARTGYAVYFSRSIVPYVRDAGEPGSVAWLKRARFYKHLGIYAYRKELLLQFVQWPPTELEQAEKLEQLRALDHGVPIRALVTPHDSIGVDQPADIELVERILNS